MAIMFKKEASIGEWWEVGALLYDTTSTNDDAPITVTGKTVTLTVRDGPASTDNVVTVSGSIAEVLDGPGGTVRVGGRIATADTYYATVTVGSASDGSGWPVKEVFLLKITECP